MRRLTNVFFILLLFTLASAQTNSSLLLQEIQTAYNELNYSEVEIKAKAALKKFRQFTSPQLVEIHKILGLVYFSQNKPSEAQIQFESALSITPDLTLDPLYVSPKILEFYNQIKKEWILRQNQSTNDRPKSEVRYILVQDPRPAAALRSMILPGWGQSYKGEKNKGFLFASLWSVGILSSLVTHLARGNAEDRYLSETDPARIQSEYDKFNKLNKLRNNLLFFSAGVWVYSYLDAILSRGPRKNRLPQNRRAFLVLPAASPKQAHLTILIKF
ncbi:MAG: hypothetical protein ACE5IR_13385 [bacterium]